MLMMNIFMRFCEEKHLEYNRRIVEIDRYINNLETMSIKKINGYKIHLNQGLGTGAYGTVYKGEQDGTKEECAIKVIDRQKICADPYLKSALLSEIQIMSKIKSPNVVGFFDVLESKHNYYIVQELCDNDLEKALKVQPCQKFTEEQAISYLTEICNGFLTLVREGIVHRDLKPANILLSKGVIKIGDFGFAKQNIHKQVKNQSCVGTPLYMPIQVLKGMAYTSKCDIWAIGCMFYQMLHGETPWTARTEFQLITNIQKKIFTLDPKLSDKSKDFISKTLKLYEDDRMSWDELFKHPIFGGYFSKYHDENTLFENKYKKVMADLRFKINSENIDVTRLWKDLGFEKDQEFNFQSFEKFLQAIDPNMIKAQATYFFQKMDINGDGSISIKQLSSQLEKYQICLTSKHRKIIPLKIQKTNSLDTMNLDEDSLDSCNQDKWDEEFEKKVRHCFNKLYQIISNKGLTLYKTFNAYDMDKSGELEIEEFQKIIKNLDPSFTLDEIQAIFHLIDEDGSKTIQFDQLNNYYCKVNGIPVNMHLPKEYRENRKKTTKKSNKENAGRQKKKTQLH